MTSIRPMLTRLNIFLLLLSALMLTGCVDERFYVDDPGEGEATISAEVVFSSVLNPLGSRSRAEWPDSSTVSPLPVPGPPVKGDVIKQINSLCIFIYRADGDKSLYKRILVSDPNADGVFNYTVEENGNTEHPEISSNSKGHQAETATPKASFTLKGIPFGKYYFYAVANMGDLSEYDDKALSTPDKLKDIKLTWNSDNIAANNQMFGYFTLATEKSSTGFNAPLITVGKVAMQLHAWVKRAASKVTVAIDGSDLYDGVQVFIESIQVRDISRYCWLGKEHVASAHYLIDGQKKVLGTQDAKDGREVNKEKSYPETIDDAHTETADAYFFYENMQGTGQLKYQVWPDSEPGASSDKKKPQYPDGNNPNDVGYKDHVVAGTYIEVTGYYRSNNTTEGEGPIIYRFMLGKDTEKDYNVERNHHYKLTLKLKGWGNDSDWHIVYDQEPEIIGRNPYYISYVYDETMGYPVKILGGKLLSLKATIPTKDVIDNDQYFKDHPDEYAKFKNINEDSWHPMNVKENEKTYPYWNAGTPDNPGPWNGFLSLRKTTRAVFGAVGDGFGSNESITYTYNESYYDNFNRGERIYNVSEGLHKDAANGDYTIINNGDGEWLATIPLYTRARVMVAQTGYTGNNPYVAYRRRAGIRIEAKVLRNDGTEETVVKYIEIQQMRRIVNPKGIWRSKDCTDPFHVTMMIKESENITEDFKPLYSDGPWLAVIQYGKKDGAWFDIEPTPGVSQKNPDGSISGTGDPFAMEKNEGCKIDFTFRPKGTTTEPRGGIIKIYYNNYTCVHRIFVRQGYEPVAFYNSNVQWHSSNLLSASKEVSDPVLEGSYFRRHNLQMPIASSNNTHELSPFDGKIHDGMSRSFTIVDGTPKTWKGISIKDTGNASKNVPYGGNSRWTNDGYFTLENGDPNKKYRIASKEDLKDIMDNPNTIYGYGVLYTDGTGTEATPTKVDEVYGYAASPGNTAGKGMRGVFVCDSLSGMNIFLPIGGSGYGRFKQESPNADVYNRLPKGNGGVIQYANRYAEMPETGSSVGGGKAEINNGKGYGVAYKPIFWDLFRRPGALYWLHEYKDGSYISDWKSVPALDINYYSFDFALTTLSNVGLQWPESGWGSPNDPSGTDAVQIRLVEVPADKK